MKKDLKAEKLRIKGKGIFCRKGFTLIEILSVIVVFGIILIPVSSMLATGLDAWRRQETRRELLHNGSFIMDWISRELKEAGNIEIVSDSEIDFTIDTDGDEMVDMPVKYYLAGSSFMRKQGVQDAQILGECVDEVTFFQDRLLKVQLVLEHDCQHLEFATKIRNRN